MHPCISYYSVFLCDNFFIRKQPHPRVINAIITRCDSYHNEGYIEKAIKIVLQVCLFDAMFSVLKKFKYKFMSYSFEIVITQGIQDLNTYISSL